MHISDDQQRLTITHVISEHCKDRAQCPSTKRLACAYLHNVLKTCWLIFQSQKVAQCAMQALCEKHNIPTAFYKSFTEVQPAHDYIRKKGTPIVIKASGLAAGKGVIIAHTEQEACDAASSMLSGDAFGAAGSTIVIEEFLEGEEASYFALIDGPTVLGLTSAQDHKAAHDGDTGPNTGGMGAYSPAPVVTPAIEQQACSASTGRGLCHSAA